MPLLDDDVQVPNASPQAIHAPMAPSQDMSMQSMSSMAMDPAISPNTSLAQIIIMESDA